MSVIVPVRNGGPLLTRCLDALAAQQGAPAYEVIVVDNGSTDGSAQFAREHPARPTVVTEPRRGSYAARNAGAATATGEVLACTDVDCVPMPGWLARGVAAVASADLVGGRITATAATNPVGRYDAALYLDQEEFVAQQGFAATANLFVRTDVFRDLHGFDATLRSGGDVEFCQRATRAGHLLAYAADAVVRHDPRTSYRELWRLHRRLGAGWHDLAARGLRPAARHDPALRWPTFGSAVDRVNLTSPSLRRRQVAGPHAVAMTARWVGRLTGR